MSFLSDAVEEVTIETRFTPAITLKQPLAGGGAPSPFALLFKPKITVKTRFGTSEQAPYGEPGQTLWPLLQVGGMIAAVVALALMVRGFRK